MTLDRKTVDALHEAIEDEYKARATYRKVIEVFGAVRPFINIVEAEDRHVKALLALYRRFALAPPQDTWPDRVEIPATLVEACRAGVNGEIENEEMYDRLLSQVSDPSVRRVLKNLQRASKERHLPAFKRCVSRGLGNQTGGKNIEVRDGPRRMRRRRGRCW